MHFAFIQGPLLAVFGRKSFNHLTFCVITSTSMRWELCIPCEHTEDVDVVVKLPSPGPAKEYYHFCKLRSIGCAKERFSSSRHQ